MKLFGVLFRHLVITSGFRQWTKGFSKMGSVIITVGTLLTLFYGLLAGVIFMIMFILSAYIVTFLFTSFFAYYGIPHNMARILSHLIIWLPVLLSLGFYHLGSKQINKRIRSSLISLKPSCHTAFQISKFYLDKSSAPIPVADTYWELHFKSTIAPSSVSIRNYRTLQNQLLKDLSLLPEVIQGDAVFYGTTFRNIEPVLRDIRGTFTHTHLSAATVHPRMAKLYKKHPRPWRYMVFYLSKSNQIPQ